VERAGRGREEEMGHGVWGTRRCPTVPEVCKVARWDIVTVTEDVELECEPSQGTSRSFWRNRSLGVSGSASGCHR